MEGGDPRPASAVEKFWAQVGRQYQHLLDKSTVHLKARWAAFAGLLLFYLIRVYMLNGWFIVTYGLGIYLLNMFIGFLSPQVDPETEGPVLPTAGRDTEEYRPFNRRVPEFKFWHKATVAVVVSIGMTFFSFFDIPVFWPILLVYFILLFVMTMRKQIAHMIKHKYVPVSWGKKTYSKKDPLNAPGAAPSKGVAL
ncbi:Protein RER1 [Hondaea fermentalgiana]|uniref:Protein RER1 n=1 Tax=Hondaea fermentalgiana TaxID=2315210 RepID=A0A2R5GJ85_9STRA|nr:Protein RER1 [Hondaea fermentalgiana]|eukprot:GBG30379.1 Protein RER1 [Hondaea fermentalgiana]